MTTPAQGRRRLTLTAGLLLLGFAGLVGANTLVSVVRGGATGADVSFVALLLVIAAVAGRSLHRGARWAWWISLAVAAVGLLAMIPFTVTILFSGSAEPVGTGWDIVFFPLTTLDLIALATVLWLVRRQGGPTPSSTPEKT